MDFIEEMEWRGMLHDMTPGVKDALSKGMCTGYIGFDPTAPSMTIGNYVQVMVLNLWQQSGHRPIALMGGATGRIGDPSGKDKERQLKTFEELDNNLAFQAKQMESYLEFGSTGNKALLRNNHDFYKEMNALDFLRDVGKTITVSYMMSKDSVKTRLETGLSFTEFSYQLLQAYDFQCLYLQDDCRFQMGGSDQWGNITSGTEFIRRNIDDGKAYAVTSKLLAKSDGKKFGKSEEGNIWMDAKLTTPYKFYQFWINAEDTDISMFLRYFSLKSRADIIELESNIATNPNAVKRSLGEELTTRIHGDAYQAVEEVSSIIFDKKLDSDTLKGMSLKSLEMVSKEITSFNHSRSLLASEIPLQDLLTQHCPIFSSLGEFRRAIKGNAISLNKTKIADTNTTISATDLVQGKYLMLENGKKNKYLIVFS